MASMDAQAIYDNFHTHAQGTPGLAGAQQTAAQLAAKYQDRAVATQQLIDGVQTGWKGAASEAAAQGLTPLAVSSLDAHGQLNNGQDIVGRQVDSFHTAVSEVQPVPPAPQMSNVITAAVAGQDTTPMIDQIAHSYAAQASNVVAYNKYVSASQYNTSNLPPITPVDAPAAPVSVTTPSPASAAAASGSAHAPTMSGGSGRRANAIYSTGPGGSGSGSGVSRLPAAGGPTLPPGSGSSGSTTISSAPPPAPPAQSSPSGPGVGSGPGQNPPLGSGGPGVGSPGGGIVWPGGGSGGGGPTSGWPGEGENIGTGPGSGIGASNEDAGGVGGIRSGTSGPGGRMSFDPNSGAGTANGAGNQGPGGRSGAGAGSAGSASAAEEEALAAERGSGPGGIDSTAGAMGAGRGGEDTEHQRKFGVEEDGEELFGLSEAVMPPVVGEDRAAREHRYAEEDARHPNQ